jgi:signal transduction histidine kinase
MARRQIVNQVEVAPGSDSQAAFAMRSRRPVVVDDLSHEGRFQAAPIFRELGVMSSVNVVIEGTDRPFGVLEVDAKEPRNYSRADVTFMQAVANVLSSAVARRAHDEEREQLLSLVSHELRNPLTVISGFSTQLSHSLTGTNAAREWLEATESIRDSATRMECILNMLMQLGQVERGAVPQFEQLDLHALISEIVAEAGTRYPGVEFDEVYEDHALVVTDELWARAALSNIVGNAAKYSRGAPIVFIQLRGSETRGFEVRVRDTCGGINGDELDRLFDRFFRGQSGRGVDGLGLGLCVARRAADMLGWNTDVITYPGDGCEFRITGPLSGAAIRIEA